MRIPTTESCVPRDFSTMAKGTAWMSVPPHSGQIGVVGRCQACPQLSQVISIWSSTRRPRSSSVSPQIGQVMSRATCQSVLGPALGAGSLPPSLNLDSDRQDTTDSVRLADRPEVVVWTAAVIVALIHVGDDQRIGWVCIAHQADGTVVIRLENTAPSSSRLVAMAALSRAT